LAKFLEHFRLAASRNEVRVKARCIDVVVAGDPIALRIEQALRQIGVGNPFLDEVLPLERDRRAGPVEHARLHLPRLRFVRQAQSDLGGIGAHEIDTDPIFPFESADDGPHDLIGDLHRIPGDTAFLFCGLDQGRISGDGRAGRRQKARKRDQHNTDLFHRPAP